MLSASTTDSGAPMVLHTRVVTGAGGGPEKTILNSPRWLATLGYRSACAYMHPPGDPGFEQLRRKAEQWDAPLISIPDRGAWDLQVVTRLLAVCRREQVTIWHGHDYKSNALGLLLKQFWPMKVVTTVHGWVKHTRKTPVYYAIDRLCLSRCDAVICVSDDLYSTCRQAGVRDEKCVLIENAIDLSEYSRTATIDTMKERLGFRRDRLLFGAAGRLSEEKGFDLLIRAFDQVLQSGVQADLVIAGEGDQQTRLQELISSLGRGEEIRLLGYRSDVLQLFQALDGFVLSSLREGLPNVVLEAMALGVPVLATRIAGVPRLIQHGENGYLIEPGDLAGLVGGLVALVRDADLRSRLAAAGRATVAERHSFAERMKKIVAIYDSVLAASPAQRATDARPPEVLTSSERGCRVH